MKTTELSVPELALIAGTRAAAGAGAGLLLAGMLPDKTRKSLGWSLFAAGALSTIPLAMRIFEKLHDDTPPTVQS